MIPYYNIREIIEGESRYFQSVNNELKSKMTLPERFELFVRTYDPTTFYIKDSKTNKIYKSHTMDNNGNRIFYDIEGLQKIILEDLKHEFRKKRIEKLLNIK